MADCQSQWSYHARFLEPQYLCHVGPQFLCHVSMVLQFLCHVSVDLKIFVISEWCYHARILGPQYLCHVRLGVPVVPPC